MLAYFMPFKHQYLLKMTSNLSKSKHQSPIEDVAYSYKLVLNRALDENGKIGWLEIIEKNQYSKLQLIDTLLSSYEYLYKTKKIGRFSALVKMRTILNFASSESTTLLQQAEFAYKFFCIVSLMPSLLN